MHQRPFLMPDHPPLRERGGPVRVQQASGPRQAPVPRGAGGTRVSWLPGGERGGGGGRRGGHGGGVEEHRVGSVRGEAKELDCLRRDTALNNRGPRQKERGSRECLCNARRRRAPASLLAGPNRPGGEGREGGGGHDRGEAQRPTKIPSPTSARPAAVPAVAKRAPARPAV
jgi:hypothetical protein